VVIFGTLGLVQCSAGYNGSMSILGWIMFWRFFVGLGIGAEYPLSAVITAEYVCPIPLSCSRDLNDSRSPSDALCLVAG
jgi:MFS family permease